MSDVREATPDELARWDATAVDGPGGHVLQSRAWAAHRRSTGWRPLNLVAPDGTFVLVLTRPWPVIGGGSAYLPRGPIPDVDDATRLADRLAAVAEHLAGRAMDVIATDAEVPASSGYGEAIRGHGFRPIEEIQPARHRMSIPLGGGRDEETVLAGVAKTTRARIRSAEAAGILVRRYDARSSDGVEGARPALESFYDLELATADRRDFSLGPKRRFVDWWVAALDAGHLVYLEAHAPGDPMPMAGLVLYRHGRRLTTVQSADRMEDRRRFPGVLHLLRWRAIQLAIAERRDEMDLGGADVAGARHLPAPGEPMFGLYEHKASFGATWVEQSGAHEWIVRPTRYTAGRALSRVGRAVGGVA